MISPKHLGGLDDPAPTFATAWAEQGDVVSARLYITSRGLYRAELNGVRVGDHQLAPGWTAYASRLVYETHDVTELVRGGENRLEVTVGNGWYRGNLGRPQRRDLHGDRLGLLAQLELRFADGSRRVIGTDDGWSVHSSDILSDDLYNGQLTELRGSADASAQDVAAPDGEHGGEHSVEAVDFDLGTLVAQQTEPMRVVAEVPAVEIITSPSGKTLVDFGQNLVGWVRLRVRGGRAADTVTVRHAEVLEHGELGVRPLRTARATDQYLLPADDQSDRTLEPEFTFHGFRYAEVEGVEGLEPGDLTAIVISSDLERTGSFESSNPMLNQLHENVVWGMRGNFLSVPTDCPQRDERLGWTGDIHVFAPTAGSLFDTSGFLSNWCEDLAAEQLPDDSVPVVIPDVMRRPAPAAAAWGDAAVVVPWVLYQQFGDVAVLERQFESMCGWVDKMHELAGDDLLWVGGFQYGDWLDPTAPPDKPAKAMTPHDVVATAHLAYSADLVSRAAAVMGRAEDADRYAELAGTTRAAFRSAYVTADALMIGDSQTAYSMAIEWGLLDDAQSRQRAGDRLADLVRRSGFTIGTGFVGTPLILDALTDTGHLDIAFRLLSQTENPSWLYPITMGATTIWERWDSMLEDGTINPGQMTSFNHYAYGVAADWMHRVIGGLAFADPGRRTMVVDPRPGAGVTSATTRQRTPYGEAAVSWTLEDEVLRLSVTVPTGSSALVTVSGGMDGGGVSGASGASGVSGTDVERVESGTHEWSIRVPSVQRPALGATPTTRETIDDEEVWSQIVAAAQSIDPSWTQKALAEGAGQYLDRDIHEITRLMGRSIIYRKEGVFTDEIDRILGVRRA